MTEGTVVLVSAVGGAAALECAAFVVGALVDHRHEVAWAAEQVYAKTRAAFAALVTALAARAAQTGPAAVAALVWLLEHTLRTHGRHRAGVA